MAIPTIVEMSFCMEMVCLLRISISERTISIFLEREEHPEHGGWTGPLGVDVGMGTVGAVVGLAEGAGGLGELEPLDRGEDSGADTGVVEGGGPGGGGGEGGGADGGSIAAAEGSAGAGGQAGAGGWKDGKYCIMCWVLMPSSRSLSLSERKVMDSSFFFKFESKLVILVCAKFSCIFRNSLVAAS